MFLLVVIWTFFYRFTCKSVDVGTGSILKPAEWKFQKTPTKWHQLQALVDFNKLFPISDKADNHSLKEQLQVFVTEFFFSSF